jgi:hypothetical protein
VGYATTNDATTVFSNEIRMLQRTQMLQRTRRTLKRCSFAGINCWNLWNIITRILTLWKWTLIILMAPCWPTLEGPKIQDKAVNPGFIFQKGGQTDDPPSVQSPKMSGNDDSTPSTSVWFFMIFIRESLFIFTLGEYCLCFYYGKFDYSFH